MTGPVVLAAIVVVVLVVALSVFALWLGHRRSKAALLALKYHANGVVFGWGKTTLVGRKEVRWCPDCGTMAHDYRTQEMHAAHHKQLDSLADRVAELERLAAEAYGGGPVEEPKEVPWTAATVPSSGPEDVTGASDPELETGDREAVWARIDAIRDKINR